MQLKITVIGAGFVGIPTALSFASDGFFVTLVEKDSRKLEVLRAGKMPLYEPGLDDALTTALAAKTLTLMSSDDLAAAIKGSRFIYLTLPTPTINGKCDIRALENACKDLAPHLAPGQVVVVKSTVRPGTTQHLYDLIAQNAPQLQSPQGCLLDMGMNPETLAEGTAWRDVRKPDRIIFGRRNSAIDPYVHQLFAPRILDDKGKLRIFNSYESAELSKYLSNALLAARLSMLNETARVCEEVGADIREVADGAGRDSRIGLRFLHPSLMWGGSCFGKDILSLKEAGESLHLSMPMSGAVHAANEYGLTRFIERLDRHFHSLANKTIAVWGLAFKPETSDVRYSPAVLVVKSLLEKGAYVRVHDFKAITEAKVELGEHPRLTYVSVAEKYPMLQDADALILLTEWDGYRNPDWMEVARFLKKPGLVADMRSIWDSALVTKHNLDYLGAGRSLLRAGTPHHAYERALGDLK